MISKDENVSNWLESCPLPVVGRVLSDIELLRHLAYSTFLYEQGTVVVVPLTVLEELFCEK